MDLQTDDPLADLLGNEDFGRAPRDRRAGNRMAMRKFSNRSPWTTVLKVLGVLLCIGAVVNEGYARYVEVELTEAVQRVTGNDDLEVHCRRVWDELIQPRAVHGFAEIGGTTAHISLPVCHDAASWADDPLADDNRLGLHVVAHEVAHLIGHGVEAETECVAMFATPQFGRALGGTEAEGIASAQWYQKSYNPLLTPEYQNPGCLSGPAPRSELLD